MQFSRNLALLFVVAGCCLAVTKPDWKLGTVLDTPALHQPQGIETPVFSPDGKAVRSLPVVQAISLQGTQLVVLGASTAFVVDPGPNTGVTEVGHGLMRRDVYVCQLAPREQVMYAEKTEKKGDRLEILDSAGRVCALDVVRQQQVQTRALGKTQ